MQRLPRGALEAVLEFLEDTSQFELNDPYPDEILTRLERLVHAMGVIYQLADDHAGTFLEVRGVGLGSGDDDQEADELYWALGPCPTHRHRMSTADLAAVRTSDFMTKGAFHSTALFQEYFRPVGIEHIMDFGLPAPPGQTRSLVFVRDRECPDFTDRDGSVLELLRPHLSSMERQVRVRRDLAALLADRQAYETQRAEPTFSAMLTNREREIVELLAAGHTNAEIAASLWIAPSTVKKHLENIYAKTGVGRRAAVAALGSPGGQLRR